MQREHSLQFAIVGLRPNVKAVGDAHQLRCDPNLRAIAADAALNDIRDAELAADFANVAAFCFELKHGSARHDFELRHLRQHIQKLLGHAIRKIILIRVAADIGERQNGNRITIGDRRCGQIAFSE